jgi:hypothetical protein
LSVFSRRVHTGMVRMPGALILLETPVCALVLDAEGAL